MYMRTLQIEHAGTILETLGSGYMADMLSSAVVQETVNQIVSSMEEKYKEGSDTKEHMERLEMAHIRLEAALEVSTSAAHHCCGGGASSSAPCKSAVRRCTGASGMSEKRKKWKMG